MDKTLRGFLIFAAVYFIFDGVLHFSGVKLLSVANLWPSPAVVYASLLNQLYASFIILAGVIAFFLQKDLKKYRTLVKVSAVWAFLHGIILVNLIYSKNLGQVFMPWDSLRVWLPFYDQYLAMNALMLFLFCGIVFLWIRSSRDR